MVLQAIQGRKLKAFAAGNVKALLARREITLPTLFRVREKMVHFFLFYVVPMGLLNKLLSRG